MGTKVNSNYESLLTFTRASKGHALRPVSYGTELVTNGGFDTDSDWTTQRVSIASGVADFSDNSSGPARIIQDNVYTVGKTYLVTFDVNTSGTLRVYDGSGYDGDISVSSGTISKIIYAEGTQFIIRANVTNDYTGTIDNVSVKEVTFDQPDGTLTLFEHPDNVPRVEWDADRNRLGLLVEESRTNLLPYSEDFTNANWVKVRASTAENTDGVKAPDGSTAIKLTGSTDNSSHFIYVALTATGDRTLSIFAKKAELSWLIIANTSFNVLEASFNLEDGTLGSNIGFSSSSIKDVGNGWYRCSAVVPSATADGNFDFVVALASGDGTVNFAGSSSEGVYIYGAQFEEGSFPTSYIKSNSGSTTTRSADVASIPVADFGYNQSEGTIFVEADAIGTQATTAYFSNGTTSDRFFLYVNDGYQGFVGDGGSTQAQLDGGTTVAGFNKTAMAVKKDSTALSLNGGTAVSDTSCAFPTVTKMNIGSSYNDTVNKSVYIKSIKYYPRRLTNAQLVDLTS